LELNMAGPLTTVTQMGNLHLTTMDFAEVGDQLERHWHAEDSVHITVVSRGAFRFLGREGEFPDTIMPGRPYEIDRIISAGDVIDWDVGKDHSFVALKPGSRIINIRKN
jgi:hypothetical protein